MGNYTDTEKRNLKEFFVACNEMIDGRFILSDIKISKILNAIANSAVLYDLFAKCMVDFNFKNELRNAKVSNKTNGGYFVLPDDEKKIIALVFCLLIDVDNNRINLQSFITENFFSADGYNVSYSNFALTVLVPFKNAVMNLLGVNERGEELEDFMEETTNQMVMEGFETQEKSYPAVAENPQKLLYADLLRALNQLYSAIKKDQKLKETDKEELIIVIKAIKEAISIESLLFINALVIPLERVIGKNKRLRTYYYDFRDCLVAFYN